MSEYTSTKELVIAMINGLNNHEIEEMTKYWSEDMHWYGPAGIGTKSSLKAFQEEHQKPFLCAFPDKTAHDQVYVAEGDYVATFGSQEATHEGNWLGIPASGKQVNVRYMDIWRAENGKLVENWVLIDILGFLEQLGYNIENVLKFIGSKPPEFFDHLNKDRDQDNLPKTRD